MARTDIRTDGVYVPTEIGKNIYVWMRKGASKPTGDRGCVISSHGMDMEHNEIIRAGHPTPDVDLYFYCPHGYGLPDNSAEGVMTRTTKWYERVRANTALHDYTLTKAQGSHSTVKDHETYGHIQIGFHPQGRMERSFKGLMQEVESANRKKAGPVRDGMKAAAMTTFVNDLERITPAVLDVVTIRNRGLYRGHVTLFSAVALLKAAGFNYSEIHCNFCRGGMDGHSMKSNMENIGA